MPDTARRQFNRKREIADPPPTPAERTALAGRVGYGGNPEHKRNPGDFNLIPPSAPRADKTLCDAVSPSRRRAPRPGQPRAARRFPAESLVGYSGWHPAGSSAQKP